MTAAEIATALGGYRGGSWQRCRCPVHHGDGPTLALRDGPFGLRVKCFAGCARDAVLDELRRLGLLNGSGSDTDDVRSKPDPAEIARQREADARQRQRRIAEALDLWKHETASPHGTAVERYWLARGLGLPIPPTIRASRSWLRHPSGGTRPVMVALVQHVEHRPVAIHRTWLQVDGLAKASFIAPRMALGPTGGAAVRLARPGEHLMIGEGIETTAAAMTATGLPGWAALSAGVIVALLLPPLPLARIVTILADNDVNGVGEAAARTAAQRWLAEGRAVRVVMPPTAGTDFTDLLLGVGRKNVA